MFNNRIECEENVCRNELERIRSQLQNLFPRSNPLNQFSQSYQNEINTQSPSMLYKILEEKLVHCQPHSIKTMAVNDYEKSRLTVPQRKSRKSRKRRKSKKRKK